MIYKHLRKIKQNKQILMRNLKLIKILQLNSLNKTVIKTQRCFCNNKQQLIYNDVLQNFSQKINIKLTLANKKLRS